MRLKDLGDAYRIVHEAGVNAVDEPTPIRTLILGIRRHIDDQIEEELDRIRSEEIGGPDS